MRTIIILIFTSFISCSNIDEAKKENYNYIISTQRFGCRESIVFCIKDYIEINNNAAIKIAIANDEFDDYDFYELKPNAETLKELINNMNDSTSFIYPDKNKPNSTKIHCGYVFKLEDKASRTNKSVYFDEVHSNIVQMTIIKLVNELIDSKQKERCEPFILKINYLKADKELRKNWGEPPVQTYIEFTPPSSNK